MCIRDRSKGALGENIIQSQPGFCSIVKMLKKHIFFVILDINKNRVFFSAFIQCCGPILTSPTCEIAKAVEIVPTRFTDVCEIQINVSVKNIYIQINCHIDKSLLQHLTRSTVKSVMRKCFPTLNGFKVLVRYYWIED